MALHYSLAYKQLQEVQYEKVSYEIDPLVCPKCQGESEHIILWCKECLSAIGFAFRRAGRELRSPREAAPDWASYGGHAVGL